MPTVGQTSPLSTWVAVGVIPDIFIFSTSPPPPPLDEDIFHARSSRSPPATLFGQHRPDRICPVLPAKVGIVHASMCMVCVCVMSLGRATVSPNHFSFHSLYIFIFTWIDRWHCTPPLQNIAVHV